MRGYKYRKIRRKFQGKEVKAGGLSLDFFFKFYFSIFSFSMSSQFSSHILFPAIESLNEVMYHHLVGHKAGNTEPIRLQVY